MNSGVKSIERIEMKLTSDWTYKNINNWKRIFALVAGFISTLLILILLLLKPLQFSYGFELIIEIPLLILALIYQYQIIKEEI
ncbi:MAG: hypothetical protein ACE5KE_00580 [Methanosarcinales archaeon]